ncbi:ATP-binding protein [Streptomyces sp. NPDC005574]|uniref:ATP-binding protein n=1 Tax=Streptomyces sp. NPDC005574 TaxID=3156891 RepID=UPI0033A54972
MTSAYRPDSTTSSVPSVERDLTGGSEMIPASRDVVREFVARLREAGVALAGTFEDSARLVVSELVTNVVRHAPGPSRLRMTLRGDSAEIAVSDTGEGWPTFLPRDPLRIGRHGLEIVTRLCGEVITKPGEIGKTVSVRLPLR